MTALPSDFTLKRQARASDPTGSAWVSANAGSGKTYVLVQRVVRLLLAGADPSRILCLTFTKAAAANMQNRVVERLRGWATAPAQDLAAEIAALDGATPSPARLAQARKLFARALETPGGLKIYTIHAFCGRLLHQFPFEANVAAGFAEIDDRDQAALKAEARAETLARAARSPDGAIGRALAYLAARFPEQTIYGALDLAMAKRRDLTALLAEPAIGDVPGMARELRRIFNLNEEDVEDALEFSVLDGGVPASEWPAYAAELRLGSDKDIKLGDCFAAAAHATSLPDRRAAYLSAFFTQAGPPKKALVTAATRKAKPAIADALDAELLRLSALSAKLSAAAIVARTEALATLARSASESYAAAKSARGLLDYDDLISRTRDLLSRTRSQWVLFKLDGGLDHILIDEAQDTSPEQWEIISKLTEDFLRGDSARPRDRTVFAVGDEKQSIFGFQGAEPASFGEARRRYGALHAGAQLKFEDVKLTESFRSTGAVLAGVDAIFARPEAHKGLISEDNLATVHQTTRRDAPGLVELWPIVTAEQGAFSEEAWDAPFDRVNPRSAVVRLAEKIAESVVSAHEKDGFAYGEILILVRQRKALFEAILRALKARGAPVAGADRLVVGEHIAVMDLMALARAVTTPDDDLSLACALKSPLFGLDDNDLLTIAPGRRGRLADALADGQPKAQAAHERLSAFAREARLRTPFGFFAHVLTKAGGRKAFRARLGGEADDPLDAFLELAQEFGRAHPPTLAGFLIWMAAAPAEIKRDLDVSSGEVRVMTVHGAKGLEARLVVLADTCGGAAAGRGSPLVMLPRPLAGHGAAAIPVWVAKKADDPAPLREAREAITARAEAEHRRLLYVALTRAQDRLIVCGHETTRARPDGAWYDLVKDGLASHPATEVSDDDAGARLVLRSGGSGPVAPAPREAQGRTGEALPGWLTSLAPAEAAPGPPLSPSALIAEDAENAPALGGPAAEAARLRGSLLHRLLKALPDLAPDKRPDAAARIMLGAGAALDDETRTEIVSSALAVLAEPAFVDVFAAPGLGEVPIVGSLADGRPVSGRIDRLVVMDDEVLVIDYKTDRRPPPPGVAPPAAYAAQIAAYVELANRIWPQKRVRGAILWTAAPRLDLTPPPVA